MFISEARTSRQRAKLPFSSSLCRLPAKGVAQIRGGSSHFRLHKNPSQTCLSIFWFQLIVDVNKLTTKSSHHTGTGWSQLASFTSLAADELLPRAFLALLQGFSSFEQVSAGPKGAGLSSVDTAEHAQCPGAWVYSCFFLFVC